MENKKVFLAIDLGAGSGRLMAALYNGKNITLEEVDRWASEPVDENGSKHWDIAAIFGHIKAALAKAAAKYADSAVSVAVDTWGVDYGLLDANDNLINNPFIYRDSRTDGMQDRVFAKVSKDEIYAETGIQFMFFNTIFQLESELGKPAISKAKTFLMMPDIINWLLTGVKTNERTNASTTQLYNPNNKAWSVKLLDKIGIPRGIFSAPFAEAGTVIGELKDSLKAELGFKSLKVVSAPSHDTAAAIAGIPARTTPCAYLNSGTWSLAGMELSAPLINAQTLKENFTNEVGVENTIRFLKNITGMWLFQKSRESWAKAGQNLSYAQTDALAAAAKPMFSHFDPDHKDFAMPDDMVKAIENHCAARGRNIPRDIGQLCRCIQESIALKYAHVFSVLGRLTGEKLEVLSVVGGGSKDKALTQMTADATGMTIYAGPTESTSFGNVLMQLKAAGDISNLKEGRAIVDASVKPQIYTPQKESSRMWRDALENFQQNILEK